MNTVNESETIKYLSSSKNIDWNLISQSPIITDNVFQLFGDKIDVNLAVATNIFTIIPPNVDWSIVSSYPNISRPILDHYQFYLDWRFVSQFTLLSHEELILYSDRLDWDIISEHQHLSYIDMKVFIEKINWTIAIKFQKIPETILGQISNGDIVYKNAPIYQCLSETWINDNASDLDWNDVIKYQKVSPQCLLKNIGYIADLYQLSETIRFPIEFLEQVEPDSINWEIQRDINAKI